MAESLFTSQTPSTTNNSDGGAAGIVTATTMRAAIDGSITHVRFFSTTTVGGTYTVAVWAPTAPDSAPAGTLLASKVMGVTPSAGAWNSVALDTPVARTAGQPFRVALHSSQGRYVTLPSLFSSADLVNGNLTADRSGDDPFGLGAMRNGTFAGNAASSAYPGSNGAGTCYFVDVVYASGPTDVAGVLAAPLGALTAAVTGTREVSATAVASLGTLTAAATGVREVAGVASAPLGALTAAMAGTRQVVGVLAANLGPLTADMVTVRAVGSAAPITAQTSTARVVSQTTARTFTAQTRGGAL